MPAEVIETEVRKRLHELMGQVAAPIVADVALAMVKGAAQGYRDAVQITPTDANRRLLTALDLDVRAVVAALGH